MKLGRGIFYGLCSIPIGIYALVALVNSKEFVSELIILGLLTYTISIPLVFFTLQSLKNVPTEVLNSLQLHRVRGSLFLKKFYLPVMLSSLIKGSLIGWALGWTLLPLIEASFSETKGVGTLITEVSKGGDHITSTVTITVITMLVTAVTFAGHRLRSRTRRLGFE